MNHVCEARATNAETITLSCESDIGTMLDIWIDDFARKAATLTPRQSDILAHLTKPDKAIANTLGIAVNSASLYIEDVYKLLGMKRSQAIMGSTLARLREDPEAASGLTDELRQKIERFKPDRAAIFRRLWQGNQRIADEVGLEEVQVRNRIEAITHTLGRSRYEAIALLAEYLYTEDPEALIGIVCATRIDIRATLSDQAAVNFMRDSLPRPPTISP